jgi:transposase
VATAHVILAEIGLDMTRFPTAGHLASWARLAPGVKESAGKKKGKGSPGHGNIYLARVLGNAATAAGKTDTFLGERYRRIEMPVACRKRQLDRCRSRCWPTFGAGTRYGDGPGLRRGPGRAVVATASRSS